MDHQPSLELLESVHSFPGVYQIKAIGLNDWDFVGRVLAAVARHVAASSDVDHTLRETKGGRHIAVTLDVSVTSADQVLAIYAEIGEVEGLMLLL